ncbi:hypothetical protein WEI85_00305 [Actinomycetes bacterium KLBMP 9797]
MRTTNASAPRNNPGEDLMSADNRYARATRAFNLLGQPLVLPIIFVAGENQGAWDEQLKTADPHALSAAVRALQDFGLVTSTCPSGPVDPECLVLTERGRKLRELLAAL